MTVAASWSLLLVAGLGFIISGLFVTDPTEAAESTTSGTLHDVGGALSMLGVLNDWGPATILNKGPQASLGFFFAGLRQGSPWRAVPSRLLEGWPFFSSAAVRVLSLHAAVPLVAVLLGSVGAGRLAIGLQLTAMVALPLTIINLTIMPRSARTEAGRASGSRAVAARRMSASSSGTSVPSKSGGSSLFE